MIKYVKVDKRRVPDNHPEGLIYAVLKEISTTTSPEYELMSVDQCYPDRFRLHVAHTYEDIDTKRKTIRQRAISYEKARYKKA